MITDSLYYGGLREEDQKRLFNSVAEELDTATTPEARQKILDQLHYFVSVSSGLPLTEDAQRHNALLLEL